MQTSSLFYGSHEIKVDAFNIAAEYGASAHGSRGVKIGIFTHFDKSYLSLVANCLQ